MVSGNLGAVSPTSVWVFVDSTEDHDLNGRLASPAFGITTFSGVLALITRMEQFYNEKRFPQSSMQIRSFHKKKRGKRRRKSRLSRRRNSAGIWRRCSPASAWRSPGNGRRL